MKEYIQDLLNGYVYIDAETNNHSIQWIFGSDNEWDPPIPFEGNYGEIFEEATEYIYERFYESEDASGYYLLLDDIPNEEGQLAVLGLPDGKKYYYYSEKPFDLQEGGYSQFGSVIEELLYELERQGIKIESPIGRAAIKPQIYKLDEGWVIVFSEVVYAKHPTHMGIIAKNIEEANRIMEALMIRLRETPISWRSRRDFFHDIKFKEQYNGSEEANKLRYKYLKKIKEAYEKFDFSGLFDDLADDCSWGGKQGKSAVIKSLIDGAASMKERNYWHRCTLVQVGKAVSPLEFNTEADGKGKRIRVSLLYNQGEICMIDEAPRQTNFCRMTIAPDGKIRSYYATLPSGSYHVIE